MPFCGPVERRLVLEETMAHHRPPPGSYGMLLALGPGFCSELVLLGW